MAISSNPTIQIKGNIGTDIDERKVGNTKVARFRVITNDRRKNDKDEWEDANTSGWSIAAWDKLGQKVIDHLEKGDPVMIFGKIFEDSWVDSDGNKRFSTEVRAESIGLDIERVK